MSEKNLSVVVGRPIAINCPVNGIPTPKIVWYKDGAVLDVSERNYRLLAAGRRLEITMAEVSDTGRYKCEATNVAGKTDREFQLNVQGRFFFMSALKYV